MNYDDCTLRLWTADELKSSPYSASNKPDDWDVH